MREGGTSRSAYASSSAAKRGAISVGHAAPYLKRLKKHVKAVVDAGGLRASPEDDEEQSAALDALACFVRPMTYLVIEDFGTKGLTGDPCANLEHERNNNFWGFFRAIGISPKGESDAGSWGLGKWVFPDASVINTYIGMTQRVDEDNWLLMGMSLLKTHHLGSTKYRYYGSFAAHDDRDDEAWFQCRSVRATIRTSYCGHSRTSSSRSGWIGEPACPSSCPTPETS